jgi:hypothetical protein
VEEVTAEKKKERIRDEEERREKVKRKGRKD